VATATTTWRADGPDGKGFKAKFNDDLYTYSVYHAMFALSEAMAKAKSTDPVKVAALEGMKFKSFNGEVEMRKTDHQLQQGLYISKWQKADGKNPTAWRTPATPSRR
jgi:branched-chain amino acid transport system substrate-binding protein